MARPDGWSPYKIDGKTVPSVTSVWKSVVNAPALNNWLTKREVEDWRNAYRRAATVHGSDITQLEDLAKAYFEQSIDARPDPAGVGTLVHQMIEEELWSGCPKASTLLQLNDEGHRAYEHWRAWSKGHRIVPYGLEVRVFSRQYRFAGTIDFVGLVDDVFTVVDYKTSSRVYLDHLVQIAAYRHALRETLDLPVEPHGLVLRFPQDQPKFEVRSVPWFEQDRLMELFVAARTLYDPVTRPLWKAA